MKQELLTAVENRIRELVPRLKKYVYIGYAIKEGHQPQVQKALPQISLEAVLEALFEKFIKTPKDKRGCVTTDRDILFLSKSWVYGEPLSGQAPETIKFIANLLEVK